MDANPSRTRIVERIRAGLDTASARGHVESAPPASNSEPRVSAIFAPVETSLNRFRAECEANRTELHLVDEENEAACLGEILAEAPTAPDPGVDSSPSEPRIFVQDAPELRRLMEKISTPARWSSGGPPRASDIAGITLAEALVARTGSVLITALDGGRAASVLPPLHIVYAEASQLVNELGEALERLQASGRTREISMACLISGPSRTSDIEKMLVLGAHGPRRLVVLLRQ